MKTIRKYFQNISLKRILLAIFLAVAIFILLAITTVTIIRNSNIISDFLREKFCYKRVIYGFDVPEVRTDCKGAGVVLMGWFIIGLPTLAGILSAILAKKYRVIHGVIALVGMLVLIKLYGTYGFTMYKKGPIGFKKELSFVSRETFLDDYWKELNRKATEEVLHKKILSDGTSAIPTTVRLLTIDMVDANGYQQLILNFSKELVINKNGEEVESTLNRIQTTIENNRVPTPRVLLYKFLIEGEEINKSQWVKQLE